MIQVNQAIIKKMIKKQINFITFFSYVPFILVFLFLLFMHCRTYTLKPYQLEGKYASGVLKEDTLYIIAVKGKLYYFRKYREFEKYGGVELDEYQTVRFYPWEFHGELEKESFYGSFSSMYQIIDNQIYLFQKDANSDIIKEYYYKKVSDFIEPNIKKLITENVEEIKRRTNK